MVAHAVEGLANLADNGLTGTAGKKREKNSVKYCRTCYDHLAGFVGVRIVEALETKGYLTNRKKHMLFPKRDGNGFCPLIFQKMILKRAVAR